MLRLSENLGAPEWQPLQLLVEGKQREALVYSQGGAWAAVIDVDDRIELGMSGIGIERDEHALVVIEDLSCHPRPPIIHIDR
jgi:hypothetical protein